MEELFSAVDAYFIDKLIEKEAIFDQVLANNQKHGLPPHDVSPSQGKFLYLLSKIAKAQRILEIGTLGGYSTIWFAKALPQNGKIISLEFDQTHAKVAQENTKLAGFSDEIDIIVGPLC